MASLRRFAGQSENGLPHLWRERGAARLQRPCVTKSGACCAVGHGTKRNVHTAAGHADQQPQGVVDLREGTQLSGSDCVPRKRDRLPVLHKQKSARRIQRSGDRRAAHRRRVAPNAQWRTYAGDGHSGQHKKSLVGMSAGACLEGRHLLKNRRKKMRLPRLRGKNTSCAALKIRPAARRA